jgi:polyisoprenoid-binding protein YceI
MAPHRPRLATGTQLLAAALVFAFAAGARAESRSFPLDPAHAEIAFRAYAFGVVPTDGMFSRFSGTLTVDPDAPGTCRVDVNVEVASLQMSNRSVRGEVLSAGLLDAADFPTLVYSGSCDPGGIDGALTLHGATHPLHLAIVNSPPRYSAEAAIHRRDWGITGRPLLCGPTVRIRVSTTISR